MKPRLSSDASEALSLTYVTLRQADVQPGRQRSMRMTVRQLEALVRLSEAVAKLHFSSEVTSDHVWAARDVFSASLNQVKRGNLDFEDLDDIDFMDGNEGDAKQTDNTRPQVTVDDYLRLSQLVANYVSENAGTADDVVEKEGLISCLMQDVLAAESEDELHNNYTLLWYVMNRMTVKDHILIEEVITTEEGKEVTCVRLHPNYVADANDNYDPNRPARHATMPPEFFEETAAEQLQPEIDPDLIDAYFDE